MIDPDMVERLKQPLDQKLVKKRKQGGRDVSYLEGHAVISQANDIFGFDGWSYEVSDISSPAIGIWTAKVRVTALGVQRSDIGVNVAAGDSNQSQETAMKGAVTDALKRALRTFGDQFGNSLYSKDDDLVGTAIKMGGKPMCEKHHVELKKSGTTGKWGHVLEDGTACVSSL